MHSRWALGSLIGLMVVVAIIGVGCGGDDDDEGGVQPPLGTATLTGKVVAADNVTTAIANAEITVVGTNRTTTSAADGSFTLRDLPSGTCTVRVETPYSEAYGTACAQVTLVDQQTVTITLAVLPLDAPAPEQILLDPLNSTVDVGGKILYRSQVVGPNNQVLEGVQPTWIVTGGIGTISPQGVFSAQTAGSGQVIAFAGNAKRAATVVVVPPRPPQITSFNLTPQVLPATGGDVFISCAVADGDGVLERDVTVQIFLPEGSTTEIGASVTNPNTALACEGVANCYLDASFGATFTAPPNDNQPSLDGVQAPENYSARIQVRDRSGTTAQSEFIDFTVQGIDQPPPRPPI